MEGGFHSFLAFSARRGMVEASVSIETMVIEDIVQIGNPLLSRKAKRVASTDSRETRETIANLIDSLRQNDLIGMAAPQIGASSRIFVTEIRRTRYRKLEPEPLRVYINPVIVWRSKREVEMYEGCGSVAYAKFFAPVRRPEKVTVEATDEHGKRFTVKADGMLARVIQHEYDHLDGVTFIERISDIRKAMSFEEYRKRIMTKPAAERKRGPDLSEG